MSTLVSGSFRVLKTKEPTVDQLRTFSFEMQRTACKEKIGLSFIPTSDIAFPALPPSYLQLLFELSDSPFEHTADNLFGEDGCEELDENGQVITAATELSVRIESVLALLNAAFAFSFISHIVLQIKFWEGEPILERTVALDRFKETLLTDYSENCDSASAFLYTISIDSF